MSGSVSGVRPAGEPGYVEYELLVSPTDVGIAFPLRGPARGRGEHGFLEIEIPIPDQVEAEPDGESLAGADATLLVLDAGGVFDIVPSAIAEAWIEDRTPRSLVVLLDLHAEPAPRKSPNEQLVRYETGAKARLLSFKNTPVASNGLVHVELLWCTPSRVRAECPFMIRTGFEIELSFALRDGVCVGHNCIVVESRQERSGRHRFVGLWTSTTDENRERMRRFLIEEYLDVGSVSGP